MSVHPAGMAVDLRVSQSAESREWLEGMLLGLEKRGVLDVTREDSPPHYHVAIFPDAYAAYATEQMAAGAERMTVSEAADIRDEARPGAEWLVVVALLLGSGWMIGRRHSVGSLDEPAGAWIDRAHETKSV